MSVPYTPSAETSRGDAVPAARVEEGDATATTTRAGADHTNVVPFVKRHRHEGETGAKVGLAPGERPAPAVLIQDRRAWMLALVLGSFTAHAGVYWMLNREPPPLASIGTESMSVEIVLGTDLPAGHTEQAVDSEQEPAELARQAAQEAPHPESRQEALQQPEPQPVPHVDAAPAVPAPEQPAPAPPVLAVPSAKDAVPALPAARARRAETAAARQPKHEHPVRQRQAMLSAPAAPTMSSSGVGRGRSDADTNYRGLVAAHLARYKRFPPDARSRGDQGIASVFFSLDGAGRVTSVALVRGSGAASLDQEVRAMVHRASPFPAPPTGRPMSFTVPVSFRLQ